MEIWRDIEGYENYKVSNEGRVYSIEREYEGGYGAKCKTGGKILKPHVNQYRDNRVTVILCKNGVTKSFFVSVLVAKAFPEICGQWFEGCEVDHKDCDTQNNFAENLRVCTKKENMANPLTREHLKQAMNREEVAEKRRMRMQGDNNPARKYMTEEWRRKISESQIGKTNVNCRKKVILEKEGELKEFDSVSMAAEFLSTRAGDISAVCRGRYSRVKGWHAWYA